MKSHTKTQTHGPVSVHALLLSAAERGNVQELEELINQGANVKVANGRGATPLHLAALKGHAEVVKVLIKAGAPVDAEKQRGSTPLYLARRGSERRQEEERQVELALLEGGASPHGALEYGWSWSR